MRIESLINECTGCFACYNACPADAITMSEENEGFYYPRIDTDKCIKCGKCDRICPQLKDLEYKSTTKAFYGWSQNDDARKNSSSGGIFHELATYTLKQGGVVYGAAFCYGETLRLECKSTEEVDLPALMKSKYVQNYIGYAFRDIKKDVDAGTLVLYCGTPCQIDGLRSFLVKEYSNLITCDFVCHGVPSMSLLREHLDFIGYKNATSIDFRPKKREWVDNFDIKDRRGRKRSIHWRLDEYFYAFEKSLNIRRSCFNCKHSTGKRAADITLADFWGIYKYAPKEFDKRGISLLLANSAHGCEIIERIKSSVKIKELPLEHSYYVYERIRSEKTSGYDIEKRNRFINDVQVLGYKTAVKKNNIYVPKSSKIKYRIKETIKKILRR